MSEPLTESETFSCGCILQTVYDDQHTLIYVPCNLACENYIFYINESRQKGIEPIVIDGRL